MCEVSVYLISQGKEKEIMRDVQLLDTRDDAILLTDLLGKEKKLRAKIKAVNLAQHKVTLEEL